MQIYGPSNVHGLSAVNGTSTARTNAPAPVNPSSQAADQLDISEAGLFLDQLQALPEIRQDRVAELRAAIAEGNYDSDEKMGLALDRLLDEIG